MSGQRRSCMRRSSQTRWRRRERRPPQRFAATAAAGPQPPRCSCMTPQGLSMRGRAGRNTLRDYSLLQRFNRERSNPAVVRVIGHGLMI